MLCECKSNFGEKNMRKHESASPFLIGGYMPGDIVHEAIQKSWIDRQIRFELWDGLAIMEAIELKSN